MSKIQVVNNTHSGFTAPVSFQLLTPYFKFDLIELPEDFLTFQ